MLNYTGDDPKLTFSLPLVYLKVTFSFPLAYFYFTLPYL